VSFTGQADSSDGQSGIGREPGRHGFGEYWQLKNVHVTLTDNLG
jgi:acyl-CoA reductase-like NAD-dependent aldehyde dehydrogenase